MSDECLVSVKNDVLLRTLDDTVADRSAPHTTRCNTDKPKGIESEGFKFGAEDTRGQPEFAETLAKRRDHLHRMRFHATDVVDSFRETLYDAFHNNSALNAMEASSKATGNRVMGKIGGAIDSIGKKKDAMKDTQSSTLEVKEINLDWAKKYPAVSYGREMREKHFSHLPKGYLDGAGFGCTPAAVLEAHEQWNSTNQHNPVMWRFKMPLRLADAEMNLAKELGIDVNDLKLTTGIEASLCSVLESLPWKVGDGILLVTDEANYVRKAVERVQKRNGVHIEVIAPPAPFTDDQIRKLVAEFCKKEHKPIAYKLAILPEVTYKSGVKIGTTKINKELHQKGLSVFVDGSMAVGNRDLSLQAKGCDWYGASLHNWMYCEPGVGFLVCNQLKQPCTNTLTVSYFDRGSAAAPEFVPSFEKEFSYAGLQDFANWCALYHAMRFVVHCCAPEKTSFMGSLANMGSTPWGNVRKYTHRLAKQVVEKVTKEWGTSPLQKDGDYAGMPVIPLPGGEGFGDDVAANLTLHFAMRDESRGGPMSLRIVSVPMAKDSGSVPTLCARFTCQIYNEIDEYVAAAKYVKELLACPGYSGVSTGLDQVLAQQMAQTFA